MLTSVRAVILGLLFALAALPAHAQGTAKPKATLNAEIGQQFPDNTSGLITPLSARTVTNDFVASFQQVPQVNLQTGTTYTIQASDYGQVVRFNNSSPVAVTIPQATGSFAVFSAYINQIGTGTVTITPASGTIDGAGSFVLQQNQNILAVSDGTNWQVLRSTPGVASIAGTSGSFLLDSTLAIITGTTSTNGPYTTGATTITVTSLKGMSVGQAITLHFDDTSTSNVTVTALGNSQLGATVTFTPAIPGGKTMSATDQITWSQVLALNSDYFPPYYPTGFGAAATGHNVAWLDNDNNQFKSNSLGMSSADYSINGTITDFCGATSATPPITCNQGPVNGDTTTIVMAKGSAINLNAVAATVTSITVISADNLSAQAGNSAIFHINGAGHCASTQSIAITSVGGGPTQWTLNFASTSITMDAGCLVDLAPIQSFAAQPAKAAATTGTNPSSVTVTSSIQIPNSDTIFIVLSDASLFTTTVSSMTPVGGCVALSAPCTWTLNFSPAVSGGRTINSGAAIYWNYSYSASTAAVVPSDTMATHMRKIANAVNADPHLTAAGNQAVLQGVTANSATLIIEPKRLAFAHPVPSLAVFESPGTANHLQLNKSASNTPPGNAPLGFSQSVNNLDASAILNLSRAASGFQPQIGDAVGFLTFTGITDDGTWLCCTAQYGSIISYISNPTPGASLLGTMAFFTAGSLGVNRRIDLNKGLAFYTDAGVIATGGDQGAGTINVPTTGGFFVDGTAGVNCSAGTFNAATAIFTKGILTKCF